MATRGGDDIGASRQSGGVMPAGQNVWPKADDTVLRPGDKVRVAFDFARWVGRHPTAVMTVASITRTEDDVTILGLRWGPSASPGGPEVAAVAKANQPNQPERRPMMPYTASS